MARTKFGPLVPIDSHSGHRSLYSIHCDRRRSFPTGCAHSMGKRILFIRGPNFEMLRRVHECLRASARRKISSCCGWGTRLYAQGDLGNCEGKREKLRPANRRTARICGGPVHDSAIRQAANWSRFSFCWVTSPSRRRSDTSGASSVSGMRLTITSPGPVNGVPEGIRWEMKITGPNSFEWSYTLEATAGGTSAGGDSGVDWEAGAESGI